MIRIALGFALPVALGAMLLGVELRQRSVSTGEDELGRLAVALSDQADRAFQSLELVEVGLAEQLQDQPRAASDAFLRAGTSVAMHRLLHERVSALPQVDAINLLDAAGRPINSSEDGWRSGGKAIVECGIDRSMAREKESDTFVGEPVRNPTTGLQSVCLMRRIRSADGTALGFVAGAIRLQYFEDLYNRIATDAGDAISLSRRDGIVLVRYPRPSRPAAVPNVSAMHWAHLPPPGGQTVRRDISVLDGQDRFIALNILDRFPLMLAVSRSAQSMLEGWHRQVAVLAGVTLLVELGLLGMVLLTRSQLRAQTLLTRAVAAEAAGAVALGREREQASQARRRQDLRFRATIESMDQGLLMFEPDGRIRVTNPRFAELLRIEPRELGLPRSLRGLALRMLRCGCLDRADLFDLRDQASRAIGGEAPAAFVWELSDGRSLAISLSEVPEEGWVATLDDVTERRLAEARIVHMAQHDPLTGLPNRTLFHDRLRDAVARARRGEGCALLFLDLDRFKEVNDTLGHATGDALLRVVTERLLAHVREIDGVSRLGGDEFAVLQNNVATAMAAAGLAGRLIEALSSPFELDGTPVSIGTSIGIALLMPGQDETEDGLLRKADLALYQAKATGRGRYRFFEPEMEAAMQARHQLQTELLRALAEDEFELHYQPLLRLSDQRVVGFEALLRWNHPQRGQVPPLSFIGFAEETGLIVPIGAWVLRRACLDAAGWPGDLRVAVNISPAQVTRTGVLVGQVREALDASGLLPSRLELEITETAMVEDTEDTLDVLHQIRAMGIGIALDDFGTGYSSLSFLRKFPFDKVKIDQSFVRDMLRSQGSAAIVRAVLQLGASLGMRRVAEGVETLQQASMLAAEGCDEGQGYLFGAPKPASTILPWLLQFAGAEP